MRSFLLILATLCLTIGLFADPQLKPRQPNWRNEVVALHENGNPSEVLFYEPTPAGGEKVVQKMILFDTGAIHSQMDVAEFGGELLPHGVRVELTADGKLAKYSFHQQGKLEGEAKTFFPNGSPSAIVSFRDGKQHGLAKRFYEDGQVQEEESYVDGELEGELIRYHADGHRAAVIPFLAGKAHGTAREWFPSGSVRLEQRFVNGALHGDGKNTAVILYDEEHHIREIADFREGTAYGTRVQYYPSGKESYRVSYRNGLKNGKERTFGEDGQLLGEGLFNEGIPMGRHWRNHPGGALAFQAQFDKQGQLLEPVTEFNEQGQKLREFFFVGEKLEGPYLEWYPDGQPRVEYNYIAGQMEGEQREYYNNGHLKAFSTYKIGKKDGLHQQWYDNGVLALRAHFADDLREGAVGEWYPSGTSKIDNYFTADQPDGVQCEWHDNSLLKQRYEFAQGVKNGWQREWNRRGDLLFEAMYENGIVNGAIVLWWRLDELRGRFPYVNGKKEGKHEWFYENGKPERIAIFHEDRLDGDNSAWYADGAVHSVQHFKAGVPVGEHLEYYPESGQLAKSAHYDDKGQFDGEQASYAPTGELLTQLSYRHGKLEGKFFQVLPEGYQEICTYKDNFKEGPYTLYYPPNEQKVREKALEGSFAKDQRHGLFVEYGATGVKLSESLYSTGLKEGTAHFYGATGGLEASVDFHADRRHGFVTRYFPSGAIAQKTPYVADMREGEEVEYHENGQIAASYLYRDDLLQGLCRNWNSEGVLIFEGEYQNGKKHGKFNKYYDDGRLRVAQTFFQDEIAGQKQRY